MIAQAPVHAMRGCAARRCAARAAVLLVFAATAPARAASPELAEYERFAQSASGAQLLAVAREALCVAAARCDSLSLVAPDWPAAPRPLFVTLAHGSRTRACLGRDEPRGTLTESVRELASEALSGDRRRPPVRAEELDSLRVLVAFAGDERAIADPYQVNPMREGLRIATERGTVAFLPGEARTVSWALGEARRIGVLGRLDDARFSRFDAVVLSGPAVLDTIVPVRAPGPPSRPVIKTHP